MINKIHQLIVAHRSQLLFFLKEEANVVINVVIYFHKGVNWFYVKLNTVFQSIFHTFLFVYAEFVHMQIYVI